MDRCPRALMTRDVEQLVLASGMCEESGVLPCAGGMLDQSSSFIAGMAAFRAERSKVADEMKEVQDRIDRALGKAGRAR